MTAAFEHASQPLTRRQLREQERKAAATKTASLAPASPASSTPTRVTRRDLRKAGLLDKNLDTMTSAFAGPGASPASAGHDTEEITYRPGEITAAVDRAVPVPIKRTTTPPAQPAAHDVPASEATAPSAREVAPELLTRRQLRLMSQGGRTLGAAPSNASTPSAASAPGAGHGRARSARRAESTRTSAPQRGISFMRNGRASFPQVAAVSVIALSTIIAPLAGMSLPSSLASLHTPDSSSSRENGPSIVAAKLGQLPTGTEENGSISAGELSGGADLEAEAKAQEAADRALRAQGDPGAMARAARENENTVNQATDWPSLNDKFSDFDGDNAKDLDGPVLNRVISESGFIRDPAAASRNKQRVAEICEGGGTHIDTTDIVVSPVDKRVYRLTSRFGAQRGRYTHLGDDLAAPLGTPIYAAADGQVIYAGEGKQGRSSYLVIIRHVIDGQQFDTWYVHMYASGVFVREGQQVRAGEQIAAVGSNGRSTGPHLHFEVHTANDTPIPAYEWLVRMGAVNVDDLC